MIDFWDQLIVKYNYDFSLEFFVLQVGFVIESSDSNWWHSLLVHAKFESLSVLTQGFYYF